MKQKMNKILDLKKIDYKFIFNYILKIIVACIIIIVCLFSADFSQKNIQKINLDKMKKEKTKNENVVKDNWSLFLAIVVKYSIYLIGIYIVCIYLGFNTSLIIAAFGTCGIAIALGLQGSLSNLVSGLLITFSGIYKVGEIIETNVDKGQGMNESLIGKIIDYDLFKFHLKDINTGLYYSIPNNQMWDSVVSNYNHFNDKLYLTVKIIISDKNNLRHVRQIINDVCLKEKKIIKENTWPSPFINIVNSEMNFGGLVVLVKFLTNLKDYPNIEDTIQNDIIIKLKENNIKFL